MKKEESDNIQPNTKRGIKHIMQCLWDTIWWDIIMDISPMAILRKVIVIFVIEIAVLLSLCSENRKQKEQAIEEWQDEGGNVYLNGILQKSELDLDGLDLDNFKVEYRNGKLYIQN
jgi:hypothetical protein